MINAVASATNIMANTVSYIDSIPTPAMVFNRAKSLVWANVSGTDLLGFKDSVDLLLDTEWYAGFKPGDHKLLRRAVSDCITTKEPTRCTYNLEYKSSGRRVIVVSDLHPILDTGGYPVGVLSFCKDVTLEYTLLDELRGMRKEIKRGEKNVQI